MEDGLGAKAAVSGDMWRRGLALGLCFQKGCVVERLKNCSTFSPSDTGTVLIMGQVKCDT